MTFRNLYKINQYFFIGFFLFLIISLFILLFYSKANGFYLLNPFHARWLDYFFTVYTYVGDGYFCFSAGLLLFVFKDRYTGLMAMVTYSVSGILSQVLKNYILEARPAVNVNTSGYTHFIENVTLHNFHSFPSGHTTSAFALAAVLSFGAKNKKYTILYLALAMLVGYSRIYLGQHFPDDVVAGALLGAVTSVICWMSFEKLFTRWLSKGKGNT
ncbi:MAG TPA: phosphatase PAP2 family protein [Chitinophagaceae bacterium]|nr:phosphatase PAP2 family protein [Chitinophagaceae bacterium]